jgi:hypothetical protein
VSVSGGGAEGGWGAGGVRKISVRELFVPLRNWATLFPVLARSSKTLVNSEIVNDSLHAAVSNPNIKFGIVSHLAVQFASLEVGS